jgi:hypothetical protein
LPKDAKNGGASGTTGSIGSGGGDNGSNGEGFVHLHTSHHRDFRDDLCNSFHKSKLNFPHYDGEADPLPWLNRSESYFQGTRTMIVEQVWLASLHMDDVAAEWYYALERDYNMLSWAWFAELINLRFGPLICSSPLGELKELHHTNTVEDYQW